MRVKSGILLKGTLFLGAKMDNRVECGYIDVICGPMFAGKTEELIRRIRRLEISGEPFLVFKPSIDLRYSPYEEIVSHNLTKSKCICVNSSEEILKYADDTKYIIIDEVQFFDKGIIRVCDKLADDGHPVICAGLDLDFKGEPFGSVPELLAIAEHVTKLTAVCNVSKRAASRTQRLINGVPARYDDPVILVGAKESYEARSRKYHVVPGKK